MLIDGQIGGTVDADWGGDAAALVEQVRQADAIDDDVLVTFAMAAEGDRVADAIRARFTGAVDRFTLYTPYAIDPSVVVRIVRDLHVAAQTP